MQYYTYDDPNEAPPHPHMHLIDDVPRFVYPTPTTIHLDTISPSTFNIQVPADPLISPITLGIVACGAKKVSPEQTPIRADELYIGSLHRAALERSRMYHDATLIASGAHGLLAPDQLVPHYDYKLENRKAVMRAWGKFVAAELLLWISRYRSRRKSSPSIVIYAGRTYYTAILDGLALHPDTQDLRVYTPYAMHTGMGFIISWLQNGPPEEDYLIQA